MPEEKRQQRAEETSDAGNVPTAAVKTEPQRGKVKTLPPYKVLLHNDDVNTFQHVVVSILKVTSFSLAEAETKTAEAHHRGVTVLLVTHKERAELYCEQLATFGLIATIEPDV